MYTESSGCLWPSSFSPPWKACHFWDLGWQGGGGGEGGNYVRNTRIPCNLQCFLVAQILAKKPRLRRRLETMRVLQCFLCQEGRMHWYSQYFVDAGYEPFFRRGCFNAVRPKEVSS